MNLPTGTAATPKLRHPLLQCCTGKSKLELFNPLLARIFAVKRPPWHLLENENTRVRVESSFSYDRVKLSVITYLLRSTMTALVRTHQNTRSTKNVARSHVVAGPEWEDVTTRAAHRVTRTARRDRRVGRREPRVRMHL
jgi:hypothetical protein